MIDDTYIKKNFGEAVKNLRNNKKITQEQLAEVLDLQRETITSIEVGRAFVSSTVMANLCNYFNVEPSYFFKANFDDFVGDNKEIKNEINRLLSDCSYEDLEKYYNILVALKK